MSAAPAIRSLNAVYAQQLGEFVEAVRDVIDRAHNSADFWAESLGLARRASNI